MVLCFNFFPFYCITANNIWIWLHFWTYLFTFLHKKAFKVTKNLSKQPLLWKTNSCIAAKYIEIGTTLQNTHHSSFFLHELDFLTLWKNQSFIQSQLPKGITYVGANASQCCLIKHLHLCKWYLYSELITKRYHLRRCKC